MKLNKFYLCTNAVIAILITVSCWSEAYASNEDSAKQKLFALMDKNADGEVTQEEYLGRYLSTFDNKDADSDGKLSDTEFTHRAFKVIDADNSGNLTLAEYKTFFSSKFDRLDKDKSGTIILDELLGVATASKPTAAKLEFPALQSEVQSLAKLTTAPAMTEAEVEGSTADLKAIYFDSLDWRGKPTKVFAWLGLPKNANQQKKVPGIVLVHGGGGSAFKEWVQKWNDQGFAAISIAVEGQTDVRDADKRWQQHQWAGPQRSGIYGDSDQALKDQWMYHAVADTVLANSLIRSLPEVDADKVGVMGISWGGVITSTVIGIDNRFAFAIPTYGCGGLSKAENQYGRALGNSEMYQQVWDPLLRMDKATTPTLWFSWPGDVHFPLDRQAACYRAMAGPHSVSLVPGMRHGHGPGWNLPDSYAFAKSIVEDGKPWCLQQNASVDGDQCNVSFASTKRLKDAILISTTDSGATGSRNWIETPAKLTEQGELWQASATLPQNSTAWFIITHSGGLTASSDFQEVE